jgi:hypothetical protein
MAIFDEELRKKLEGREEKIVNLQFFESLGIQRIEIPFIFLTLTQQMEGISKEDWEKIEVPVQLSCNVLHSHLLKKNDYQYYFGCNGIHSLGAC